MAVKLCVKYEVNVLCGHCCENFKSHIFLTWIVYENDTQNLVRKYENNKPLGVNRQRY